MFWLQSVSRVERRPLILFVTAALAYLPGITWGLPNAVTRDRLDVWSPDDIAPLAPLTEMFNTFVSAGSDRFLLYPLFHHFLLAAAYSPYLLWLVLTGQFQGMSATYPFGIRDPVTAFATMTIIARCMSIAMAAGIVVAAYDIALTCWRDRRTAVFAAVAAGAVYPMAYYSKTANVDVPVLFWTALGLAVYGRIVVSGFTSSRARMLGVFAALAVATKDQAAGVFLLMPIGFLLARRLTTGGDAGPAAVRGAGLPPSHEASADRRSLGGGGQSCDSVWQWRPFAWLIVTGATVYALASGLVFDPSRYVAHVAYLVSERNHYSRFAEYVNWYPVSVGGTLHHLKDAGTALFWFHGPLLAALVAAGIVSSIRQRERAMLLLIPAIGHLLLFVLPVRYFYVRFAMAIALIAALFAARGLEPLRQRIRQPAIRWALIVVALAWPVTLSADLVRQMLRDSRYAASEWLAQTVAPGQRIAHFGPAGELPRLDVAVRTLRLPPGEAASAILQREAPEFVAIQPDWTSPPDLPHSAWCPPDLYGGLQNGSAGYVLVARFRTQRLIDRQLLDYPSVNPPVQIYARQDIAARISRRR